MTTGTDKQTDPAVTHTAAPLSPATLSAIPRAKNTTAAAAIAVVKRIAKVMPRLAASISALVRLRAFSTGPEIAASVIARMRSADPGTIRSYSPRSAGVGRGALQEKPTTSV